MSTYGDSLDVTRPNHEGFRPRSDSIQDVRVQHISWRRLYLAKAKLKQASNISALLAGFAMVRIVTAMYRCLVVIGTMAYM